MKEESARTGPAEAERLLAIYSRKSRFTDRGESIENQVEMCRRCLAVQFGQEAAADALVYEDEGFSGGNLERPRFKQMMSDALRRPFRAIAVYRLDRISRNTGDFARLIQDLDRLGIAFISVKEQFDTASPLGRAMMYISSVFSQLERETIAERIRDNMRELAKSGRWLGGVTPTGFASQSFTQEAANGKVKRCCRLREIPEEMATVRLIFAAFLETQSLTQTEACLRRRGCLGKKGRGFSRFTIKAILTNPVYLRADPEAYAYLRESGAALFAGSDGFDGRYGVMAYNRTLQQPGKAHRPRPMTEWIVAVGQHPGVIPGRDWVAVQKILARNRRRYGGRGEAADQAAQPGPGALCEYSK